MSLSLLLQLNPRQVKGIHLALPPLHSDDPAQGAAPWLQRLEISQSVDPTKGFPFLSPQEVLLVFYLHTQRGDHAMSQAAVETSLKERKKKKKELTSER